MPTETLTTRDELTRWLTANEHFPDLQVVRMDPMPRTSGVPLMSDITLEIAIQTGGGFEAGQTRDMRHIELLAREAKVFWIEDPRGYDAEYCSDQGVVQLDTDTPGLQLHVPARVQLVCGRLDVTEKGTRSEVIQPWINDAEFAAMVPGRPLPTALEWTAALAAEGVAAVWYVQGSEPVPAEEVPAGYGGWFLQAPTRLASGMPGVFCFNAETRGRGFVIRMQNHDPLDRALWDAVRRVVGTFQDVEIRTGTVRLNSSRWNEYLRQGWTVGE